MINITKERLRRLQKNYAEENDKYEGLTKSWKDYYNRLVSKTSPGESILVGFDPEEGDTHRILCIVAYIYWIRRFIKYVN